MAGPWEKYQAQAGPWTKYQEGSTSVPGLEKLGGAPPGPPAAPIAIPMDNTRYVTGLGMPGFYPIPVGSPGESDIPTPGQKLAAAGLGATGGAILGSPVAAITGLSASAGTEEGLRKMGAPKWVSYPLGVAAGALTGGVKFLGESYPGLLPEELSPGTRTFWDMLPWKPGSKFNEFLKASRSKMQPSMQPTNPETAAGFFDNPELPPTVVNHTDPWMNFTRAPIEFRGHTSGAENFSYPPHVERIPGNPADNVAPAPLDVLPLGTSGNANFRLTPVDTRPLTSPGVNVATAPIPPRSSTSGLINISESPFVRQRTNAGVNVGEASIPPVGHTSADVNVAPATEQPPATPGTNIPPVEEKMKASEPMSDKEAHRYAHAQATEAELPGSPAGSSRGAHDYLTKEAAKLGKKSWHELTAAQKEAIGDRLREENVKQAKTAAGK